jgi:hypothetical protein
MHTGRFEPLPAKGGRVSSDVARGRLLGWLAQGAREVEWALSSIPEERWGLTPPNTSSLGEWSAERLVRHLALREQLLTLPLVRAVISPDSVGDSAPGLSFERRDAAWAPDETGAGVAHYVKALSEARFDLLQVVEAAPDAAWARSIPPGLLRDDGETTAEVGGLGWILARSHQHELEHTSTLWKLALSWKATEPPHGAPSGLLWQTADRMESH